MRVEKMEGQQKDSEKQIFEEKNRKIIRGRDKSDKQTNKEIKGKR